MSEQMLLLTLWGTLKLVFTVFPSWSKRTRSLCSQVDQSLYIGCLKKVAVKEIPKEDLHLGVICQQYSQQLVK